MKIWKILIALGCLESASCASEVTEILKILNSENPPEKKKELILASMRSSFTPKNQIPRLAPKKELEKNFEVNPLEVFGGSLPFKLYLNDYLYYFEVLPKSEGRNVVIYFSSEKRVGKDLLVELLSSDSDKSEIFILKEVSFPD